MAFYPKVLSEYHGVLKLFTLIIGAVDLYLTADSYLAIVTENPFLTVVSVCFIISFVYFVARVLGIFNVNKLLKKMELVYHITSAILLLMTSSVFFFSVVSHGCVSASYCSSSLTKRYFAALLGLLNSFVYVLAGGALLDIKLIENYSVLQMV